MGDWITGTVTSGKTGEVVEWAVKAYDEPSELHGLNGGRISKLTMKQGGRYVFNYDRGLDIEAQTAEAATTLAILMKAYN